MSSVAQQQELEPSGEVNLEATGTDGAPSALRQAATERLAEHRRRRAAARTHEQAAEAEAARRRSEPRAGARRVREAVAARYQNSVSYREFLAVEAERALAQAQAEVEVATRNARAVAEAQLQLLEEIQQSSMPQTPGPRDAALAEYTAGLRDDLAHAMADIAVAATQAMHLQPRIEFASDAAAAEPKYTVRLYEELNAGRRESTSTQAPRAQHDEHEATALDEEIAFRMAPEFDQRMPEPVGISGNVIEFPRQLVAAKKVRPRLAEGPLREDAPREPQLRIFEVEAEQMSQTPAEPASAPEWQGILLESAMAQDAAAPVEVQAPFTMQPQVAALELRLMAALVDGCCVAAGVVLFAALAAQLAGPHLRMLPLPMLGAALAMTLGVLYLLYQALFFTLSEATPGMRYARIGLCTFGDRNPTRKAMRGRMLATILAAAPLGLGLLWAWMDEDRLGWHDRISRMYQRGY